MNQDIDFEFYSQDWDNLWWPQNKQLEGTFKKLIDINKIKLSRSIKPSSNKTFPTRYAYLVWGRFDTNAHQYLKGIVKWRKALAVEPDSVDVMEELGKCLNMVNKHEEALMHFKKALQLSPSSPQAHEGILQTLQYLNKFQDYESIYEEVLNLHSMEKHSVVNFYFQKAQALVTVHEYHAAIACFKKAIELFPGLTHLHSHHAQALYLGSCFIESLSEYQRVIELDQDNRDAWNNVAFLMYHLGQIQEAIVFLEDIIERDLGNYTTMPNMIIFQYHLHQNEDALQPYLEKFKTCIDYSFEGTKHLYQSDLKLAELILKEASNETTKDFYLKKIDGIKMMFSIADKLKKSQ